MRPTTRSEWADVRPWNSSARFGTSLEQNQPFHRLFSVVSRGKGNRIINNFGAGDGNRTHVRSLGWRHGAVGPRRVQNSGELDQEMAIRGGKGNTFNETYR